MIEPTDEPRLRARLRAALAPARKARDAVGVEALRSALAAIDNAEAVAPADRGQPAALNEHIAGTAGALGAGEAARATLDEQRIRAIVAAEVEERRTAAATYDDRGQGEMAAQLRAGADLLAGFLA